MSNVHEPTAFRRGDTWKIDAIMFYRDGTPFNLGAGAKVEWILKDPAGTQVLSFTLLTGDIVVTDANGKCLVTVTPVQSAGLVAAKGFTDQLRATDPSGLVSTQTVGTIEVRDSFFV